MRQIIRRRNARYRPLPKPFPLSEEAKESVQDLLRGVFDVHHRRQIVKLRVQGARRWRFGPEHPLHPGSPLNKTQKDGIGKIFDSLAASSMVAFVVGTYARVYHLPGAPKNLALLLLLVAAYTCFYCGLMIRKGIS